jgi:hypothetical protein
MVIDPRAKLGKNGKRDDMQRDPAVQSDLSHRPYKNFRRSQRELMRLQVYESASYKGFSFGRRRNICFLALSQTNCNLCTL